MEMETSGSDSTTEAEERGGADSHHQEPSWEKPAPFPTPPEANARKKSREMVFFFFVFTVFVLDQITKAIAVFHLGKVGSGHTLYSFFAEYFALVQEFPYLDGSGWEKPAVDVLDGNSTGFDIRAGGAATEHPAEAKNPEHDARARQSDPSADAKRVGSDRARPNPG